LAKKAIDYGIFCFYDKIKDEVSGEEERQMRMDNIGCFIVLAETLNYTEAANRLYITQSVLSRTIQQMEEGEPG
jgi:DNA-binding MarR family transcriptional regulator